MFGHLLAPARVDITVVGYRGCDVHVVAVPMWRRFECTSITVTAGGGDLRAVDSNVLRTMSVGELVRPAVQSLQLAFPDDDEGAKSWLSDYVPGDLLGMYARSLWPKFPEAAAVQAAGVYRIAEAGGYPPRDAVAEAYGVSRPTASRIIAAARESGVLAEYREPRGYELDPAGGEGITFMGTHAVGEPTPEDE